MGPNVKQIGQRNAASGFSDQLLDILTGTLTQAGGAQTVGPMQRETGTAPRQMNNSFNELFSRIGGVDTVTGVEDETEGLINAITARSNRNADRSSARLIAALGGTGNRRSSALGRGLALQESEQNLNLDQILASIMQDQAARKTQARQFDVDANLRSVNPLFSIANRGILDPETIVTPGLGDQILQGLLRGGASYLRGRS